MYLLVLFYVILNNFNTSYNSHKQTAIRGHNTDMSFVFITLRSSRLNLFKPMNYLCLFILLTNLQGSYKHHIYKQGHGLF